MIDYIYANGCSYVAGDGLQSNPLKTAIYFLAEELNCECFNNAKGGGSNQRIVRTTIDWLLKNKNKWSDVLVLVGWTEFHRYEILNNKNWIQINSIDFPPEEIQNTIRYENWKSYIANFYNIWRMYNNYLDNILYLQLFLESNNIKYIFWDSIGDFSPDDDTFRYRNKYKKKWDIIDDTFRYRNKYKKKWDIINTKNWVTGGDESWEKYIQILEKEHDVRVGTGAHQGILYDYHPNELGHKFWYEKIKNKAKELSYI